MQVYTDSFISSIGHISSINPDLTCWWTTKFVAIRSSFLHRYLCHVYDCFRWSPLAGECSDEAIITPYGVCEIRNVRRAFRLLATVRPTREQEIPLVGDTCIIWGQSFECLVNTQLHYHGLSIMFSLDVKYGRDCLACCHRHLAVSVVYWLALMLQTMLYIYG